MKVEIHIQELILHGFPPGQRHRIGEAVQKELERLLVEKAWPYGSAHDLHVYHTDGGGFALDGSGRPEAAGVKIANAVHGAVGRTISNKDD
jgi:hypothetical protein